MALWRQFLPDTSQTLNQQKELTLLAMCIWGEARGASSMAQRAVGFVVRNRVNAGRNGFGIGWRGVLLKPYQFSTFNIDGGSREKLFRPLEHDSEIAWRSCFGSALICYESLYEDSSEAALFYYSGERVPIWAENMIETAEIDDLTFLKDRP